MPSLSTRLAVLADLDDPRSTSEVAEDLDLEEVVVEEAVSELEEAGLVEREGFGAKTRLVPVAPGLPQNAAHVRSALDDDAWHEMFGKERAELAYVLDGVGTLELAAFVLDAPVESVRGEAYDLVEAGLVVGDDPFEISPSVHGLRELLAEIDALRARRFVQELDPEAEIVWHLGPEVLLCARSPVNHPEVTYGGPSLFEDHGIDVEVQASVFCRTLRSLDASDAILQSLLVEPGSPEIHDACIQLFSEQPTPTFAEKARIYGLEDEAVSLRQEAGSM